MSAALKEKINEISLMLVMTSADDGPGLDLLLEMCADLSTLAATVGGHDRVVAAVAALATQRQQPTFFAVLQEFIGSLTQYIEGSPTARFPNEVAGIVEPTADPDLGPALDRSFLVEFIECHTVLLDEFEGTLLEFQNNQGDPDELTVAVKRYLHNLKGDSGSIGLLGIERVCHAIEDFLEHNSASTFVAQLITFKEWVVSCLKAYAQGARQEVGSAQFLSKVSLNSAEKIFANGASTTHSLPHEPNSVPKSTAPATSPTSSPTSPKVPTALRATDTPPTPAGEPSTYVLTGEKDILVEFANEAEEHLGNVESVVLDAEGTYSKDAVDTIFRGVHSIKGGSAYFGVEEMTRCSHILENFLSEVRDGKRQFDAPLTSLLLTYIDLQKDVLARAKKAVGKDSVMHRDPASVEFLASLDDYGRGQPLEGTSLAHSAAPRELPPTPITSSDPSTVPPPLAAQSTETAPVKRPPAPHQDGESDQKAEKLQVKTFVKVDTARLDHLIDSIGEMVIYSSMLIRHCRELLPGHPEVADATHRVEKFSRDLQDVGMSMRLVPIKSLFQKMSRLVWDTAKKLGKDVNFVMEGEDTELDRNLIDKLADPLMHMVRNSLDHGIESPADREAKGKSRAGKVSLSASHSGGSIHIRIQDDGKGLDPDKLIAKAIEKGIIQEGQKLSRAEAFQLIFAAGFSTAAVVTDISGRGVGMDVVRRNVESLRGRIHIESEVGQGSTFTIELPLTLAIIDGIQIGVGSESFIIPSLSIVEFVRPEADMVTNALDHGETFHFRGKYLPIFRLGDLYGIAPRYSSPQEATMVVVENNQEHVAIMVDEILGECSTVIKSLGPLFEESKGIAGCAIMPRGNVALILDIRSLVQLARTAGLGGGTSGSPSVIATTARATTQPRGMMTLH